jgi:hypothetical protein
MMLHDRDLFTYPLTAQQFQSTSALQAFYQHVKPTVETSLEDSIRLGSRFRPLDHYFPPVLLPIP